MLNMRSFSVLFSGGKDSLAALLWVLDHVNHKDWDVIFVEVTGNTNVENIEYVYDICEDLGIQDKLKHVNNARRDFFECLVKWGVPVIGVYRWCMHHFKTDVLKKHAQMWQVTGIRRSDSNFRKRYDLVQYFQRSHSVSVQPLVNWTKEEVIDYIKDHGLDLSICYEFFGHSGNCMFCPYHNKAQIVKTLCDYYWRKKILAALKMMEVERGRPAGRITKEKYELWMRLAKQRTLTDPPISGGENSAKI